jgi:hypothetical protein
MRLYPGIIVAVVLMATACSTLAPLSDSELAALADPPRETADNVAALMPGAVAFIEDAERETLRRGRPLTAEETRIALAVGVAHPELVRVLVHDTFIEPRDRAFIALARKLGIEDDPSEVGRAAGHGIELKPRFAHSRRLFAHELTHVAQYERLGKAALLRDYMTQMLMVGYDRAPLEVEARANEHFE